MTNAEQYLEDDTGRFSKELSKQIDEMTFKFLAEHGYKVEKPYTIEKAETIRKQLEEDGKRFHYEFVVVKTTKKEDGSIILEQKYIPVLEDIKDD